MTDSLPITDVELDLAADPALEHLSQAAEQWGADWHRDGLGGRLDLPITAGLRHGWIRAGVQVEQIDKQRSRLRIEVQEEVLALHRPSVYVLALAGVGALVVALWPFFPFILPLAPIAAVLAVVGWLLVASRVRYRGLEDFLELVREADVE